MKILKSKSNKILLLSLVIINIIALVFMLLLVFRQNEIYNKEVNKVIENIIVNVEKKYPNVDEKEIIEFLNSNDKIDSVDILQSYGIDSQNAILKLEKQNMNFIMLSIIIIIILTVSIIVISIIYIKGRNNRIDELIEYMEQITRKKYKLEIQENSEDELSNLRNELYKITVFLKEQAELEQKEKQELSTSISDISHQLKTPLTSISIMLDNMEQNPDMEKETRLQFVHEISRQIEWVNWLVISLLKLSRLDANVVIFHKEKINANKLVENAIQNLSIPLEIKNQKVIIEGNKLLQFVGDYKWQLEAITNILKNCIEHTGEGKQIQVILEDNNLYSKIKIQDHGIGIPKEDVPHIFERFYKGKNASENSIGIGLALSKTIIEKENGYITCKSKENEGTTFEIKYMK